ncbi:hypothetical protein SAMN05444920_115129 [Nonomuraea solani]|uniref:Uncharacterized protein n=1 Tax=Nonomuraea solani TaxID=1144553 RepID=A0A1H6EQK7_9ACTN|nr:hypothetical protein [Nonomuraea solani]SEH00150.1 hypothetical protein SAMN05444920_115129 [Nonomuraea solani]
MGRSTTRQEHGGALRQDTATRHLCTGVHLDTKLRVVVLRRVHNDPRHLVAPSYGFDLVPVVVHAWRAWRLQTAQDLALLGLFAAGCAVSRPAAIVVACALAFWWTCGMIVKSARVVLPLWAKEVADHWLHRVRWRSQSDELREHRRRLRLGAIACVLLALVTLMASAPAGDAFGDTMRTAGIVLAAMAVVVAGRGAAQQVCLNRMYHATSLRPAELSPRQEAISDQQSHPYVVYRRPKPQDTGTKKPEELDWDLIDGDLIPFVGSGQLVHRWLPPFTVQLLSAVGLVDAVEHRPLEEREHARAPFQPHELVKYLKKVMAPMGDESDPTALRGFTVRDRVYVAEPDVPAPAGWLRQPPSEAELNAIIDEPYGDEHHFLEFCASVAGEIVTTVFLRLTVKGRALSLYFAACALTRTPAEYHVLNAYRENDAGAVLRSALRELPFLPCRAAGTWRLVQAPGLVAGALRARKNRMLKPRRGMAIGARISVREEKSTPWEDARLDEVTIEDHVKLIEQRLLSAVQDFLEERKIDTSAFRKRADRIINTGVLNMGGKVDMRQSAVGTNAQVRQDSREPDKSSEGGHGDERQ